ncbi:MULTISPECIES: TIGR03564 family F420-dependent LLM class oxidoreductase [Amycolatopsis]|uniref:F420-dependent oxidoreductase-like protein n=2 Tax=Amycolatopsis TaxID=1813 RepID=A0A2N3X119_9PSEU|nr:MULTISPECIES: TIGR03564 family F420-dependent LLM class oxidoreductase [Amycolatopsis]MBB2505434.1 TIGR03564 family F420-dependent LLM class oxidoreductase [Amycolatopsis echigonensis]PKV99811.1 F420-dependent oxidoreductase-like protein [Amycolatopsis niigatensis]WIV60801.1 TIGR03564 family F420-dependent LLM class oxidoreductase [Amycolatopsis sp. 2-2]
MRIAIGVGPEVVGAPAQPGEIVEQVRKAEADGFASAWSVHFSRGVDALSVLAVAGAGTSRIALGAGVVPTYPRHPLALAQQAATVQQFCGGRFTLGVGVSHRPVIEGLHGLAFTSPAEHMREYLSVLRPLLRTGEVSYRGRFYRVEGGFTVPGTTPMPVLVGALGPRMVRVAGEYADGVVTWLAGPRTLGDEIVPALLKASSAAPRIVAGLPVAVCDDAETGRAAAEQVFARYGGLENYQRLFAREGVSSPGELAVTGTETQVAQQIKRYAELGVTELWATVYPVGDAPAASIARTRALLAELSG